MEHGGRNDVARRPDGTVAKRHGGRDGRQRAAAAAAAMRHGASFGLPVPGVRAGTGDELVTEGLDGVVDGATLLASDPDAVLRTIGAFARRLHDLPAPPGLVADGHGDVVWVHGDLCPVNVLFDHTGDLVGVIDWEDTRLDDPLVDLAWTEWLVRTWHPETVPSLLGLYGAYGRAVPTAVDRRRAMAACLVRHGSREGTPQGRGDWDRRLAELDTLDLRL